MILLYGHLDVLLVCWWRVVYVQGTNVTSFTSRLHAYYMVMTKTPMPILLFKLLINRP